MKKTDIAISATRRAIVANFLDPLTALYGVAPEKVYTTQLVFKLCLYVKTTLMKHEKENDRRTANRFKIISGLWKAIQEDNKTEYENNVVSAVTYAEEIVELTGRLLRRDGEKYSDFYKIIKEFKENPYLPIRGFNKQAKPTEEFFEDDTPLSSVDFYNLGREYDRVSRMERKELKEPEKRVINQYFLEAHERFNDEFKNAQDTNERNTLFRAFFLKQLELIGKWHGQLDSANHEVNLTGLDFSGMDLSDLDLRKAVLHRCNFAGVCFDNVNLNALQLVFSCGLSQSRLDKSVLDEVQNIRKNKFDLKMFGLEKMINKKALYFSWLTNFHTLACKNSMLDVFDLKLTDLRVVTEIAMGSCYINLLPESDEYHFSKIIEGKYLFETCNRDLLLQMLEHMMSARGMRLGEEVIEFTAYQRLVLFFEYLNEKEEIENMRLILSDLPNDVRESLEPRLNSAMAKIAELESLWMRGRNYFERRLLKALMSEVEGIPDPGLGFGTEERIARALEFVQGQPLLSVDLRKVAIMRFTPEFIKQICNAPVELTEAQSQVADRFMANDKVDGEFPLHLAIKAVNVGEVRTLLKMGAIIHLSNDNQEEKFESTLELAILAGNTDILECLMISSGDVHRAIDARSIKLACILGHREIATMLVDFASADVNGKPLELDEFTINFLAECSAPPRSPAAIESASRMFRPAQFHQAKAKRQSTESDPPLEPETQSDFSSDNNRKG